MNLFLSRVKQLPWFVFFSLLGILVGWRLRGLDALSSRHAADESRQAAIRASASSPSKTADAARASHHGDAFSSSSPTLPEHTPLRVAERVVNVPECDLVGMIESVGEMTKMTDDEVRQAWAALSRSGPKQGWGSQLAGVYLVSRLARMGEKVELSGNWHAMTNEYARAFEAEAARQNPDRIRAKLAAGEAVSDTQRQIYFGAAAQKDPVAAVEFWLNPTWRIRRSKLRKGLKIKGRMSQVFTTEA